MKPGRDNIPDELPSVIPVFPLPKVILFPGSNLPLNIFEPRYLRMVEDARNSHGIIGMIQPIKPEKMQGTPPLHTVGGAGCITDFVKTEDGRYLIRLTGISRFHIENTLSGTTPYQQAQVDWSAFKEDLSPHTAFGSFDREALMAQLKLYLEKKGLEADYDGINTAPDDVLVNTLSMIIPMAIEEKQALLETRSTAERAETLQNLLMMVSAEPQIN